MKIAVVVLTYNRSDALLAVLRGLAPQCSASHEVLIADDGSRPEHVEAMKRGLPHFECRVRHVWHPDVGFTIARARNLCAARTDADYLLFIDGDCVPSRGFLEMHEAHARENQFVIGRRVLLSQRLSERATAGGLDLDGLSALEWVKLRMTGDANKLSHLAHGLGPRGRVLDRFVWKGIRGCNMAFWSEDLRRANGFDESFVGWGHEDADMVLRMHNLGCRRRNAWVGGEVFHLWHPEANRSSENTNRERVHARTASGIIRAQTGLAEALQVRDATVTELG